MNGLAIKDVQFNGATLRAAQDAENIIWVGVRWVCEGLGLSKGQMQNERKKIQTDEVLSQGKRNFVLPTEGGNQDVLCLQLDFLPLWLAKIHVTPKMRRENPMLADRLVIYQIKAKDILAAAFLDKNALVPQVDYSQQIANLRNTIEEMRQENQKMYKDISTLANIILDWKESAKNNILAIPETQKTNTYSSWKETMYQKMDADNKICWKNLTTRYINKHGKKPSRKDLIETRPSLRKKFKHAVKELMEETQEV